MAGITWKSKDPQCPLVPDTAVRAVALPLQSKEVLADPSPQSRPRKARARHMHGCSHHGHWGEADWAWEWS